MPWHRNPWWGFSFANFYRVFGFISSSQSKGGHLRETSLESPLHVSHLWGSTNAKLNQLRFCCYFVTCPEDFDLFAGICFKQSHGAQNWLPHQLPHCLPGLPDWSSPPQEWPGSSPVKIFPLFNLGTCPDHTKGIRKILLCQKIPAAKDNWTKGVGISKLPMKVRKYYLLALSWGMGLLIAGR